MYKCIVTLICNDLNTFYVIDVTTVITIGFLIHQEHKCVLDSCRALEHEGWSVTYLPVSTGGLVDVQELAAAIRPDTILVSVMAVNNEIGVVQPIT